MRMMIHKNLLGLLLSILLSSSLFAQSTTNPLPVFSYFDAQGMKSIVPFNGTAPIINSSHSMAMDPVIEFDDDIPLTFIRKYAPYFNEIGWSGITNIPGDWFRPSSSALPTNEWGNALNGLGALASPMDQNFVKIAISY